MTEEGYRLYAKPSFLTGIARLIDITGSLNRYNKARTPEEADYRSILSDWENIGLDINSAIHKANKTNDGKQ